MSVGNLRKVALLKLFDHCGIADFLSNRPTELHLSPPWLLEALSPLEQVLSPLLQWRTTLRRLEGTSLRHSQVRSALGRATWVIQIMRTRMTRIGIRWSVLGFTESG